MENQNNNPDSLLVLEPWSVLSEQIRMLDEKYNIKEFVSEVESLYKTYNSVDDVKNISMISYAFHPALNIPDEQLKPYLKKYKTLCKKYNYDSYLEEGFNIRKDFLEKRSNYFFTSLKPIVATSSTKKNKQRKLNNMENISIDYSEQIFVAKWLDKLIKNNASSNINLQYEDTDGSIKTISARYRISTFYDDGSVESPLIDRTYGKSMFDTFLLHSFYDTISKKWVYVPVKFIIKIEGDNNNGTKKKKSI